MSVAAGSIGIASAVPSAPLAASNVSLEPSTTRRRAAVASTRASASARFARAISRVSGPAWTRWDFLLGLIADFTFFRLRFVVRLVVWRADGRRFGCFLASRRIAVLEAAIGIAHRQPVFCFIVHIVNRFRRVVSLHRCRWSVLRRLFHRDLVDLESTRSV
jgi:hypothetical protein